MRTNKLICIVMLLAYGWVAIERLNEGNISAFLGYFNAGIWVCTVMVIDKMREDEL